MANDLKQLMRIGNNQGKKPPATNHTTNQFSTPMESIVSRNKWSPEETITVKSGRKEFP